MILMAEKKHLDMLLNVSPDVLADLPQYSGVEYSRKTAKTMLSGYLNTPGISIFFKEVDGQVVGLFIGIVAPLCFSSALAMSEILRWVREDHRKTDLEERLIKTMENWAVKKRAKKLFISPCSGLLSYLLGYKDQLSIKYKEVN